MADDPTVQGDQPLATLQPEGAATTSLAVRTAVARIGQGPQNDIVIDDDTVSTQHARLEFADGGWRLTDLGSRNGTYVDGVRLAAEIPTPLPDNAVVAFGAVNYAFRGRVDVEPARVATPSEETAATTQVRRAGFRLPVWLLLLVIVVAAILAFVFLSMGGSPAPAPSATIEETALFIWNILPADYT